MNLSTEKQIMDLENRLVVAEGKGKGVGWFCFQPEPGGWKSGTTRRPPEQMETSPERLRSGYHGRIRRGTGGSPPRLRKERRGCIYFSRGSSDKLPLHPKDRAGVWVWGGRRPLQDK